MRRWRLVEWMVVAAAVAVGRPAWGEGTGSKFLPGPLMARARRNIAEHAWAAEARDRLVKAAEPWLAFSDDELWNLMFGNTIKRSWMVWSNGHCPACGKSVPMYNWEMAALARPWKVRCPHCRELFPKNDFQAFYRSGLDEKGVFDPQRADRKLLFNAEHPDPADPRHTFGVDDGEGCVDGEKRWRFIGAYLIYGQWKQAIVAGIRNLAAAYVVTGEPVYAHQAGVLLDRVADLYPTFDFGKEGVMYEGPPSRGYVSTWHDACEEVRELALAYDRVADGLRDNEELVKFLSGKARTLGLENPKASLADIRRNIEERIFRDTLVNLAKIQSNRPRTEVAEVIMRTVLDWPGNRDEVYALIDTIIKASTAVDGLTGEKGLAGYTTIGPRALAELLGRYTRMDDDFLPEMLRRHPVLHQTWRFHVDTICLDRYYPQIGDTGSFAKQMTRYLGVDLGRAVSLDPSGFSFLWRLYELTGDAAFVQMLYRSNNEAVDGLPYDLFVESPESFQHAVAAGIEREGTSPRLGSVHKEQWRLAILRSGAGKGERAVWLDYDSHGPHSHRDGLNLGLFAKGLDLMPDFGYPPVQFGGWEAPRAVWYTMTAAHNTVVVDGKNQQARAGACTLWADGAQVRVIRAAAPQMYDIPQYERTVVSVDVSDEDAYLLDVFRVVGGTDHAKFMHSHFAELSTPGLKLTPAEEDGHDTQMRGFQTDAAPPAVWHADFRVVDRYGYVPEGAEVHVRYTDLSGEAEAAVGEKWVVVGLYDSSEEMWIPQVRVRRRTETGPLASTFVGLIEPYEREPIIGQMKRLPLTNAAGEAYPENHAAVEVHLVDGRKDLLVAVDVENPLARGPARPAGGVVRQADWGVETDGELCFVRRDTAGAVQRIALARGSALTVGNVTLRMTEPADCVELRIEGNAAIVESGNASNVRELLVDDTPIMVRQGK